MAASASRGVSVYVPAGFCWYSLRLPTEDGQAKLTWVAGYIPRLTLLIVPSVLTITPSRHRDG